MTRWTRKAIDALQPMPLKAVQIVHDYGTRLEFYDFDGGDHVPEYLPTLGNPNTLGAYNTKANVLGIEQRNISKFTLLHEFTHAPGTRPSATRATAPSGRARGSWPAPPIARFATTRARTRPSTWRSPPPRGSSLTRNCRTWWTRGSQRAPWASMEREYLQMNQYFSHGRLERHDPDGFAMVDGFMKETIHEAGARPTLPAMTEAEWHSFLESRQRTGQGT